MRQGGGNVTSELLPAVNTFMALRQSAVINSNNTQGWAPAAKVFSINGFAMQLL